MSEQSDRTDKAVDELMASLADEFPMGPASSAMTAMGGQLKQTLSFLRAQVMAAATGPDVAIE